MANRPQHLDLRGAQTQDRLSPTRPSFFLDLPSPRVGEIPPALSPLDAFALHSRALAKRLEEGSKNGRRMSRLPHHEIADELAKRPGYFRSISGGSDNYNDSGDETNDEREEKPFQVPAKEDRPVSHYPMLGNVKLDKEPPTSIPEIPEESWKEAQTENDGHGYFGIRVPRASSPEPFDKEAAKTEAVSPALPSLTSSIDSIQSSQPRTLTNESSSSRKQDNTLAPPRSPLHPRSPRSIASIRSVLDSEVEDNAATNGPFDAAPRRKNSKASVASAVSTSHAPLSPDFIPVGSRSPSAMSQRSVGYEDLPRPSFNFSRPRSSSGTKLSFDKRPSFETRPSFEDRPSLDIRPSVERLRSGEAPRSPLGRPTQRNPSDGEARGRTVPSRQNSDQGPDASGIMSDSDIFSGDEASSIHGDMRANGAPSYIYSKYSLPRGRTVERGSAEARASWVHHQIKWEEAAAQPPRNLQEIGRMPSSNSEQLNTRPETPRRQSPTGSGARSRSAEPKASPLSRPYHRSVPSSPSINSESTDRTVRARPHMRGSPSQDIAGLSPEQHLEKGIECHSSGSLSKSTYHLRLAAKGGLPTGMLLYALACRHGWGMRPNQTEGVTWLKRAVDSSSLEFLADQGTGPGGVAKPATAEDRTRKAQFALAIYELGMSYMNGWGIPKDKPLAVRCFEIAGSWGDLDALAEAGFCYTQGVGCKKDLKKAAEFYRRAADGGMSMAGNSWIYKPKYMPDPVPHPPEEGKGGGGGKTGTTSDGKAPSRSRARTLFGRKKAPVLT
ncbi:hypothetical protein MBLNU459_g5159t1 [Dothideomycetes sp. NU459]